MAEASPTPRPRSSTRRSPRCSLTGSAGRRHPTSHVAAESPARPSTVLARRAVACSPRSSRASSSPCCPPEPGRADPRRVRRRSSSRRRTGSGACSSWTGCAHRPRAVRPLHPGPARHQPARDPRRARPRGRRGPAGGLCAGGRPGQLAAMVLLIAQSAVQSAPLVAQWLPAGAWRAELAHALQRIPRRADAMTARILGRTPRSVRAERAAPDAGARCPRRRARHRRAGDRRRRDRRGDRAGCREPRPSDRARRAARSRARHEPVELEAHPRRTSLPRIGTGRHRARERVGAAPPPHAHRPASGAADGAGHAALRPGHMSRGAYVGVGYGLGDGLRRIVGTPDALLSAPGPIGRDETAAPRARPPHRCAPRRHAGLGRSAHRRRAARRRRRPDGGGVRGIRPHPRRGGDGGRRRRAAAGCAHRRGAAGAGEGGAERDRACGRASSIPACGCARAAARTSSSTPRDWADPTSRSRSRCREPPTGSSSPSPRCTAGPTSGSRTCPPTGRSPTSPRDGCRDRHAARHRQHGAREAADARRRAATFAGLRPLLGRGGATARRATCPVATPSSSPGAGC